MDKKSMDNQPFRTTSATHGNYKLEVVLPPRPMDTAEESKCESLSFWTSGNEVTAALGIATFTTKMMEPRLGVRNLKQKVH